MDSSLKTYANVTNRSRPLPRPPSAAPPFDPVAVERSPRKQSPSPPPPSPPPPQPQVATPPGSPPTYSALIESPSPKPYALPKQNSYPSSFTMSNPGQRMSAAQRLYANSFVNHGPSVPTLPSPSFESNVPKTVPGRESFYQANVSPYISSSFPVQLPVSSASSISSSHSPQQSFSQTYDTSFMHHSSPPYSEHSFSLDGSDHQHFDGVDLNSVSLPRCYTEPDALDLTSTSQSKRNTVFNNHSNQPTRTLFDLKYVNAGRNKPKAIRNVVTSMILSPPDLGGGGKAHVDKNTLPTRGTITPEQRKHPSSIASSTSSLMSNVSQVLPSPPPFPNTRSRPQQQQEPRSSVYHPTVGAQSDRNGENTNEQVQLNHDWDNQCLPDKGSHQPTPTAVLPRGAGQPCLVHQPSQALSHQAHPPTYDPYHYH